MNKKTKPIELTKAQYVSLLKIAFLGQWVANSFRYNRLKEYEAIEQHIMSYVKEFGANNIAGYDTELKRWFPTKIFELKMHEFIDEFQDDFFLEELIHQLAQRDVLKKFGAKFHAMSIKEKIRAEQPFIDKYYDEIQKNGIDNIGIIRDHGTGTDKKFSLN